MTEKIKWSHSRLNTLLNNPAEYFLLYKEGIKPLQKSAALEIGSAVHWGIENNTEDLTEYVKENGSFGQQDNYTKDQLLAESMIHGYLLHKDEIFRELLSDGEGGQLELLDEQHELEMVANLKSYAHPGIPNLFLGIIDLLLLTNKGFVLIDYKTSSQKPDWDKYLEQIYRYIFLLRSFFPDVPVYKIGIVNLRKTQIKQKQLESLDSFLLRLRQEYEINDDEYICTHIFDPEQLDQNLIDEYIDNLSKTVDFAENVERNQMWFINYANAVSVYGKSQFWNIFYNTEDNHLLYKIKDTIYDEDTGEIAQERICTPLDMKVLKKNNVLNKFSIFKEEIDRNNTLSKEQMNDIFKTKYLVDDELLEKYWITKEKQDGEEH